MVALINLETTLFQQTILESLVMSLCLTEILILFDDVEKPDEPEEQPEDIAQPELDLAPLAGVDVSLPKPKANFAGSGSFLEMENTYPI